MAEPVMDEGVTLPPGARLATGPEHIGFIAGVLAMSGIMIIIFSFGAYYCSELYKARKNTVPPHPHYGWAASMMGANILGAILAFLIMIWAAVNLAAQHNGKTRLVKLVSDLYGRFKPSREMKPFPEGDYPVSLRHTRSSRQISRFVHRSSELRQDLQM
jgi:hypothetical protein